MAGAGIINVPAYIAEPHVEQGELCRVLENCQLPSTELYALYPSRRFQVMKVKAFLDYMMEQLELRLNAGVEPEDDPLVKLPTT